MRDNSACVWPLTSRDELTQGYCYAIRDFSALLPHDVDIDALGGYSHACYVHLHGMSCCFAVMSTVLVNAFVLRVLCLCPTYGGYGVQRISAILLVLMESSKTPRWRVRITC